MYMYRKPLCRPSSVCPSDPSSLAFSSFPSVWETHPWASITLAMSFQLDLQEHPQRGLGGGQKECSGVPSLFLPVGLFPNHVKIWVENGFCPATLWLGVFPVSSTPGQGVVMSVSLPPTMPPLSLVPTSRATYWFLHCLLSLE